MSRLRIVNELPDALEVVAEAGFSPAELDLLAVKHGKPVRLTAVVEATSPADGEHAPQIHTLDALHLEDDASEESDLDDNSPMARYVAGLFAQAARERASDLHIEPYEQHTLIRMRIDGHLSELTRLRRSAHAALLSRLKIMADLDIAERRLPQDGRILYRNEGLNFDIRLSTLPTAYGERAVMRLLNTASERLTLADVGFEPAQLAAFNHALERPYGLVLVTGPTGSGKTTTLYAALAQMNTLDRNIMTVEDPVEYDLPGIAQTAVVPRIDMTFSRALRAILRQDPDVVMIGEIRDRETAQIAVQASLTGHLVLATLHTNTSVGAVSRLLDMGVEPFLLASSLLGVLGQRLVRLNCPHCRQPDPLYPQGQRGAGCPVCRNTGYKGRAGIYEYLEVNTHLKHMVHDSASEADMLAYARQNGMKLMSEHAFDRVHAGAVAQEEALRVIGLMEA